MKNVVILGSTGSIGESALRVVEALPGDLRVVGLAAERNAARVLAQARKFSVGTIALASRGTIDTAEAEAAGIKVLRGHEGVAELAASEEADIVLCAVVGMAGLQPVMAALQRGTDVALATKEVLVAAGGHVMAAARRSGARIMPVDSEHSALFQCLEGKAPESVRRLVLTASGGPFAFRPEVDLEKVGVEEALAHPRWRMGKKVTVDSATLMNKGLETIEARWLFDVPFESIDVAIHPESIVHSMVEFIDGSMLAQMSMPDMRYAIQYALTFPRRIAGGLPSLDLARLGALHFHEPDEKRFPCLRLAREAGRAGGTLPAVLNAANEVAVQKFLAGRCTFAGIWHTVEQVLAGHTPVREPSLEEVVAADAWARRKAGEDR